MVFASLVSMPVGGVSLVSGLRPCVSLPVWEFPGLTFAMFSQVGSLRYLVRDLLACGVDTLAKAAGPWSGEVQCRTAVQYLPDSSLKAFVYAGDRLVCNVKAFFCYGWFFPPQHKVCRFGGRQLYTGNQCLILGPSLALATFRT